MNAPLARPARPAGAWPPPRRFRWFNPWLIPVGAALQEISDGLVPVVRGYKENQGSRPRAPKAEDQRRFIAIVESTVANLAYTALSPPLPHGRLAVRMGNLNRPATRYERSVFGKQFAPLVLGLHALGFVDFQFPAIPRGEASSIAPSESFARMVAAQGVSFDDFGRHPNEEVILLNQKTGTKGDLKRERLDYIDTADTNAYRAEVRRLNEVLFAADIAFVDDGLEPVVDPKDRMLRRHFMLRPDETGQRFDLGGRLYGGFWQNLKSSRRHAIRINGEPVADLDFRSMFARLAYAHVGAEPPEGDLYAIDGLQGYRSGVKLALNTLFWDTKPTRKSWPDALGIGVGDDQDALSGQDDFTEAGVEGRLPESWSYKQTLVAIKDKHPALVGLLGSGIGGHLMFRESAVLMAVVNELLCLGMVCLPIHDGLMVQQSKKDSVKEIMENVASVMSGGLPFPVEEKLLTSSMDID